MTRDEWLTKVADELGVPTLQQQELLLDLTREVAHHIERPAGPLTLFLLGQAGGDLEQGVARIRALL